MHIQKQSQGTYVHYACAKKTVRATRPNHSHSICAPLLQSLDPPLDSPSQQLQLSDKLLALQSAGSFTGGGGGGWTGFNQTSFPLTPNFCQLNTVI